MSGIKKFLNIVMTFTSPNFQTTYKCLLFDVRNSTFTSIQCNHRSSQLTIAIIIRIDRNLHLERLFSRSQILPFLTHCATNRACLPICHLSFRSQEPQPFDPEVDRLIPMTGSYFIFSYNVQLITTSFCRLTTNDKLISCIIYTTKDYNNHPTMSNVINPTRLPIT